MWKQADDLLRYARLLHDTQPQIIIETGTHTGDSARWFADWPSVEMVITIDITDAAWKVGDGNRERINGLNGKLRRFICDSARPETAKTVADLIERHALRDIDGPRPRVMVSLDSDHSRAHVASEIELYGPLVTSGCALVIEDGVLDWLPMRTAVEHNVHSRYDGTVLEAISECEPWLLRNGFYRDAEIENMRPATMHPAGWWRKR